MKQSAKQNFFTCKCCGIDQNVDQTVHIDQDYCVTCYNKEQIYRDFMDRLNMYILMIKEEGRYTDIRKDKIKIFQTINEVILPQVSIDLEEEQVLEVLNEKRKEAFRQDIPKLAEEMGISAVKPEYINPQWVEKIKKIWNYKSLRTGAQIEGFKELFSEIIDLQEYDKDFLNTFFNNIRKSVRINRFTFIKSRDTFEIKPMSPFFDYDTSYIVNTIATYTNRLNKRTSQISQFEFFVKNLAEKCQFQTTKDALKEAIENYIQEIASKEVDKLYEQMNRKINDLENSHLIPNIAKYIMENHEHIFSTWFCKILPFKKSRFTASHARTGSRTDFIVKLHYKFKNKELKIIEEYLRETTKLMIENKYNARIERYSNKEGWNKDKIEDKIKKIENDKQKELQPEKLKELKRKNAETAPMVARLLIINSEKSFNMIMNKIIQFQYKRLKIRSEVQYITNVLESKAELKKSNNSLSAYYLIQCREW